MKNLKLNYNRSFEYKKMYGTISAYTTTYNCVKEDFPFIEAITSALSFADECIVVDGCSDDGTYEKLLELQQEVGEQKLQIYQNEFPWDEPGADGLQKAFSRALCSSDFLVQFDVDEIFDPQDAEKWKMLTKRFPKQADILHLPVIELWGPKGEATNRKNCWKWRMSRNKPEITHGINSRARITDEKTGKVYAKEGMCDGCFYVNTMNYEMLPHVGFYTQQIEDARVNNLQDYAAICNQVFNNLPCVLHYSWFNLPRKIKQLKKGAIWDKMWSLLYQKQSMERFPRS